MMFLWTLAGFAAATTRMEGDVGVFHSKNWIQGRRVEASEPIPLEFWLKHDEVQLEAFQVTLNELATPGSPKYAQWLTAEEVAAQLSPKPEALATVQNFVTTELNAPAFEINKLNSVISVTVPAELVERYLETELYHFNHIAYTKVDIVRCVAGYSLPDEVAEHVSLVGELIRFPAMRYANTTFTEITAQSRAQDSMLRGSPLRGDAEEETEASAAEWTGCGDLYGAYVNPYVLQTRYGFTMPYTGAEPTNSLGLAEFQTQYYDNTDLEAFSETCGLPTITVDYTDGGNSPNACAIGLEPCIESLLDIEYAGAIAGDIPLQVYYSTSYSLLNFANRLNTVDDPPKVVSVSYGNDEAQQTGSSFMESVSTAFMQVGAQGVSILFAAGDQGVWGREGISTHFHPDFPSGSPYVTSVGGTDFLTRTSIGEETTWADGGSGFSDEFPTADFQTVEVENYLANAGSSVNPNLYTATGRGYPDVSALAGQVNPYLISYKDGRFSAVAGTSAACPVVAAIIAQINDHLLKQGKNTLGWLNPFLYAAGQAGGAFNDVTTGNTNGGFGTGFPAAPGWDAATGWGTPIYDVLLQAALDYQNP